MSTFTANASFRIVMDGSGKVTNFESGTSVNPYSQPVATTTLCLGHLENGKWEKIEGTGFTYASGDLTGGTVTKYSAFATDPRIGTPAPLFTISTSTAVSSVMSGGFSAFFSGNDVLGGSALNDVLYGFAGNDTLVGGAGNDTLFGGEGNDVYSLTAGGGNDTITESAGSDVLDLTGSTALLADIARSGTNLVVTLNDTTTATIVNQLSATAIESVRIGSLTATWQTSATTGTAGNDVIVGTVGNDIISGNGGSDLLFGGAGNDTITSSAGNDVLNGGAGNDLLQGGTGNDTYAFLTGFGSDVINDAGGTDRLDLTGNNAVLIDAYRNGTDLVMAFDSGDSLTVRNQFSTGTIESVVHWGGSTVLQTGLTGAGATSDLLVGTANADVISGGGGGDDILLGGAGNDTLIGGIGADELNGGVGNDTLIGGAGNDDYAFSGAFGSDVINDAGGSDRIELRGTGDLISASRVGDSLALQFKNGGSITIVNQFTTGTVELANDGTTDAYLRTTLTGQASTSDLIVGTLTDEVINGGGGGQDILCGGAGNDTILGGTGFDILDGGAGNDSLLGGAGNDTYVVDSAFDTIYETTTATSGIDAGGVDTVMSSLNWTLGNLFENLTLTGTSAVIGTGNALNNVLTGNALANTLSGGGGNDTLDGGGGVDTLFGGAGNDTYVIDNTIDQLFETTTATSGIDAGGIDTVMSNVNWILGGFFENLTLTGSGVIGTGNGLNNILIGNAYTNVLSGGDGNDTLDGGGGVDTLLGGAGNDIYVVDNIADQLVETTTTTSGIDAGGVDTAMSSVNWTLGALFEKLTLTGAAAINGTGNALNNVINGNSANNVLDGGTGNDTLIGGAGSDTYYVDSTGDVVAESYTGTADTNAVVSSVSWTLTPYLRSLTLTGTAAINGTGNGGHNVLTGNSGANILIGNGGNDTINGGAGDDTLIGGKGNDMLTGGAGADKFVFAGRNHSDSIADFTVGTDKIDLASQGVRSLADISMTVSGGSTVITLRNHDTITVAGVTTLSASDFLFGTLTAVNGTSGNDTLTSTIANESLMGGTGNDVYVFDPKTCGIDTVADTGGVDNVTFNLTQGVEPVSVYRVGSSSDVAIVFDNGNVVTLQGELAAGTSIETMSLKYTDLYGTDTTSYNFGVSATSGNDAMVGANGVTNAINGGAGDDIIGGGALNDMLTGGTGADNLFGNGGDDVLYGDGTTTAQAGIDYDDELAGGGGNDTLYGQLGDDWLWGAAGNDVLDGGAGWDTATYFSSLNGISVTLTNGSGTVTDGLGGTDTLTNIEVVVGSSFDDTMTFGTGNASNLNFVGGKGDDKFIGTTANCGEFIRYDDSPAGVVVNLRTTAYSGNGVSIAGNMATDGSGGTDTLLNIDGVSGSDNADVLIGNGTSFLRGGAGNDTIVGTGTDTVGYWDGTQGARVNIGGSNYVIGGTTLIAGKGIDEFGNTDTITGVANIYGSNANDVLIGNALNNSISGNSGNDTIDGGAGADYLSGGSGADVFRFVRPTEGGDTITDFEHGTDKIQVLSGNFGNVGFYLSGATLPTSSPYLVYNQAAGSLTFNNGAGTNYTLATLSSKPTLTSSDIQIVAS